MSPRTLQLDDTIHAYLIAHGVREPDAARALREHTQAHHPRAQMQISPEQGQLLDFLVRALGVRRAIEVGTFTGYSALRIAGAMPADGKLLCCDVSDEYTALGRAAWAQAGLADRIELVLAPAAETLAAQITAGGAGTWDMVFIDADKSAYATYVDQAHALLRVGGVVAIDNVLWSGRVADPSVHDTDTDALRDLNAALAVDARWDLVMLPIGDGCTLLRKR